MPPNYCCSSILASCNVVQFICQQNCLFFVEQNCHVCALKYCSIHDAKLNNRNGQLSGTDLVLILGLPRWIQFEYMLWSVALVATHQADADALAHALSRDLAHALAHVCAHDLPHALARALAHCSCACLRRSPRTNWRQHVEFCQPDLNIALLSPSCNR